MQHRTFGKKLIIKTATVLRSIVLAVPVSQLERKEYKGSYLGPGKALAQIVADTCRGQ